MSETANKQTSEQTSEWPSAPSCILGYSGPQCTAFLLTHLDTNDLWTSAKSVCYQAFEMLIVNVKPHLLHLVLSQLIAYLDKNEQSTPIKKIKIVCVIRMVGGEGILGSRIFSVE